MTPDDPVSRGEATEASLIAAGARALGFSPAARAARPGPGARAPRKGRLRLALLSVSIVCGLALGFAGVRAALKPAADAGQAALTQALPLKKEISSAAGESREIGQLLDDVRTLRAEVEALLHKNENARLAERLRALETGRDAAAALGPRLDRLEERLARLEGVDPTPTGALTKADSGAPKPVAKAAERSGRKNPARDFVLRDVAHGVALIERGDGTLEEVIPGDTLPGVGRVTAIERRGPGWVVVTTRGVIDQRPF